MKTIDISKSEPVDSFDEDFPPCWICLLEELPLRERAEAYGICLDPVHQAEADLANARKERDRAIKEFPGLEKKLVKQLHRKFRPWTSRIKKLSTHMNEELKLIDHFYYHHERSTYENAYFTERKNYFSRPDWYCHLKTVWINFVGQVRAQYHKGKRESLRSRIVRLHKRSYHGLQTLCEKPTFPKAYLRYCSDEFWFMEDPNRASHDENYFGYQITVISIKKVFENTDWFIGDGYRSRLESRFGDSLWNDSDLLSQCQAHKHTIRLNRVDSFQTKLEKQTLRLKRLTATARDEKIAAEMQKRIEAMKRQAELTLSQLLQAEKELREANDEDFERLKSEREHKSTETINELQRQLDHLTNRNNTHEKLPENSPGGDHEGAIQNG